MAAIRAPLDENIPVLIVGVRSELDVTPFQGNEFAFPQTRTKRCQKERVPLRTNFLDGSEEVLGFLAGHRTRLMSRFVRFREFAHS
ncbi:MAG TPA: hypothetical protein VEI52_16870 [Terriglobales bacterium]|nr:hypothetical protein [Terriglobales bacterium]